MSDIPTPKECKALPQPETPPPQLLEAYLSAALGAASQVKTEPVVIHGENYTQTHVRSSQGEFDRLILPDGRVGVLDEQTRQLDVYNAATQRTEASWIAPDGQSGAKGFHAMLNPTSGAIRSEDAMTYIQAHPTMTDAPRSFAYFEFAADGQVTLCQGMSDKAEK